MYRFRECEAVDRKFEVIYCYAHLRNPDLHQEKMFKPDLIQLTKLH